MLPGPFPSFQLFLTESNPFWLYLLSGSLTPLLWIAALLLFVMTFISSFSSDADNRRVKLLAGIIFILAYQESGQHEQRSARIYGALYNRTEYVDEFQRKKMEIITAYSNDDFDSLEKRSENLEALVKNDLMNKPNELKGN